MIAMFSPCSSFTVLSYILSYDVSDSLILRGQNTSCAFQQQEAGVTPKPGEIGPRFCGAMGSLPPMPMFCPRPNQSSRHAQPLRSQQLRVTRRVTRTVTVTMTCVFHASVTASSRFIDR